MLSVLFPNESFCKIYVNSKFGQAITTGSIPLGDNFQLSPRGGLILLYVSYSCIELIIVESIAKL